jgi:hypothetical protein
MATYLALVEIADVGYGVVFPGLPRLHRHGTFAIFPDHDHDHNRHRERSEATQIDSRGD